MFGIAWPELLLIGIVAVIVIGPKDLPPLMRRAGQLARKARLMWNEMRHHWEDIPNQVGLADMEREADRLQKESFKPFLDEAMTGEDALAPGSAKPKSGKKT